MTTLTIDTASLIERARNHVMTPAEKQAQRDSFVRGMTTPCEHGALDFEQCAECRERVFAMTTLTIDTYSPPGAYTKALAQRPAQPTLPTFADRQFARSWWDHATPGERAAMRECACPSS